MFFAFLQMDWAPEGRKVLAVSRVM